MVGEAVQAACAIVRCFNDGTQTFVGMQVLVSFPVGGEMSQPESREDQCESSEALCASHCARAAWRDLRNPR